MTAPTVGVRQRRLGRQLRQFREEAGLTIEQAGKALEVSASTISRIETAQVRVRPRDLRYLLDLYRIAGAQRDELLQIAREGRTQPWWQEFKDLPNLMLVGLEADAASIWQYSALLVPGLLQTEAYARAVLSTVRRDVQPDDVERHLRLRMDRQGLLTRDPRLQYWVILDEAILHRQIGGRQVLREQLEHLIVAANLPAVTLQVLPFANGEHPGTDGEFTILRYLDPADPDIVYVEGPAGELNFDDPDVTRRCSLIFDHLQALAQSPAQSLQTLTSFVSQLQEQERN